MQHIRPAADLPGIARADHAVHQRQQSPALRRRQQRPPAQKLLLGVRQGHRLPAARKQLCRRDVILFAYQFHQLGKMGPQSFAFGL